MKKYKFTMIGWKPKVWQMTLILIFLPLSIPIIGVIACIDVYRERDIKRAKRKERLMQNKRKGRKNGKRR